MVVATQANFDNLVKDNALVLVDFWAPWCGPCKAMKPALESLPEYLEVTTLLVNVDDQPELVERFQIKSVPSLILYLNEDLIARHSGAMQLDALVQWIESETL